MSFRPWDPCAGSAHWQARQLTALTQAPQLAELQPRISRALSRGELPGRSRGRPTRWAWCRWCAESWAGLLSAVRLLPRGWRRLRAELLRLAALRGPLWRGRIGYDGVEGAGAGRTSAAGRLLPESGGLVGPECVGSRLGCARLPIPCLCAHRAACGRDWACLQKFIDMRRR